MQGTCKIRESFLQALDPSPRESLRNSPYLKWTELSRALQESVEEIHLTYVRLHFDIYHGEQACTQLTLPALHKHLLFLLKSFTDSDFSSCNLGIASVLLLQLPELSRFGPCTNSQSSIYIKIWKDFGGSLSTDKLTDSNEGAGLDSVPGWQPAG